jgi:hypothetical protein
MTDQQLIDNAVGILRDIVSFREVDLIRRPEWGDVSFEDTEADIAHILDLCETLKSLPIAFIPDGELRNITSQLRKAVQLLKGIDKFKVSAHNATNTRGTYHNELKSLADQLTTALASWIPYLRGLDGTWQAMGDRLRKVVSEATEALAKAKQEATSIVEAAREAAAVAGTVAFAEYFEHETAKLEKSAGSWLRVASVIALGTIAVAMVMWHFPSTAESPAEAWQALGTRFFLLSMMLTTTLWCGRMYKALRHQAAVTRHRHLSLLTFQAFLGSTADEGTKNAVLMEATRAVFANVSTGFISPKGGDDTESSRIVEIMKHVAPSGG